MDYLDTPVVKWTDEHGVVITAMTSDGVDLWWHFAGWVWEQVALKIALCPADNLATAFTGVSLFIAAVDHGIVGYWWQAPGAPRGI
jgi:hypothetical protein